MICARLGEPFWWWPGVLNKNMKNCTVQNCTVRSTVQHWNRGKKWILGGNFSDVATMAKIVQKKKAL